MMRAVRVVVIWSLAASLLFGLGYLYWCALNAGYAESIILAGAAWLAVCLLYFLLVIVREQTDNGRRWPWGSK